MRKHVERASHDLRAVITTYEGKHNHDVPAARGSGISRAAIPPATNMVNPGLRMPVNNNQAVHAQMTPFTLEMLQATAGTNSGYNGFANSHIHNHGHVSNNNNGNAKEEPRDDNSFLDSLLC